MFVVFAAVTAFAVVSCDEAGAGSGDGGDLPGDPITISGTVATQIDLNTFTEIAFSNPSDAVTFFLVDSGFTFEVFDSSVSTDYSFSLTLPVPDGTDLAPPPSGVSSSDPAAVGVWVELFGAREDAVIYEFTDILAFGTIEGAPGPDSTLSLESTAYLYSDRDTQLDGTSTDDLVVFDSLDLSAGWNEVLRTFTVSFGPDAELTGATQTLSNGSAPAGSEWVLVGDFLRGQVEAEADGNDPTASAFHGYDSGATVGEFLTDIYVRGTVGDGEVEFFLDDGTATTGREVLLYLGIDDGNATDGSIDLGTYTLGGSDGTDLIDAFFIVYSSTTQEQIVAGVGADSTDVVGGTFATYYQIVSGTLNLEGEVEPDTISFTLVAEDGTTLTLNYLAGIAGPTLFDYSTYDIF